MRIIFTLFILLNTFGLVLEAERIPACMLNYQYGPEQHLLIVEKSTHTLYVFSNQSEEPVDRFTVTTGKKTGQKQIEGDSKTPEGIYFFTRIISEPDLPKSDDYGEKAFVTDYPNPIDKLEGRKGSGIWLHGAHDPEKTSTPNNSRGCVVMQNDDLTKISRYIYLNQTPLCIYETIPFVSEESIIARRSELLKQLSQWKQSWEEKDTDGYMAHFAQDFSSDGLNREAFRRHKDSLNRQYRYIRVFLNNLTMFGYDQYVVVHFNQVYLSDKNHFHTHKLQYWGLASPSRMAIRAEISHRLPPVEQIEVDKGNWVSVNQFRLITEKKVKNQLVSTPNLPPENPPVSPAVQPLPQQPSIIEHSYPALQGLKTSKPSDTRMNCELSFSARKPDWRFIPVLTVISDEKITYTSLNGIRLREGIPTNPEIGKLLSTQNQQIQFELPPGAQTRSLTIFLIDPRNQIKQVVTSFFTP